jgi:hypothetical protein
MKLDVKTASIDALDAVKGKAGRICPLVCESGYRADGDRCVKITCRAGYQLNDGTCEKIEARKPVAKRERPQTPEANSTATSRPSSRATPTTEEVKNRLGCNTPTAMMSGKC